MLCHATQIQHMLKQFISVGVFLSCDQDSQTFVVLLIQSSVKLTTESVHWHLFPNYLCCSFCWIPYFQLLTLHVLYCHTDIAMVMMQSGFYQEVIVLKWNNQKFWWYSVSWTGFHNSQNLLTVCNYPEFHGKPLMLLFL